MHEPSSRGSGPDPIFAVSRNLDCDTRRQASFKATGRPCLSLLAHPWRGAPRMTAGWQGQWEAGRAVLMGGKGSFNGTKKKGQREESEGKKDLPAVLLQSWYLCLASFAAPPRLPRRGRSAAARRRGGSLRIVSIRCGAAVFRTSRRYWCCRRHAFLACYFLGVFSNLQLESKNITFFTYISYRHREDA